MVASGVQQPVACEENAVPFAMITGRLKIGKYLQRNKRAEEPWGYRENGGSSEARAAVDERQRV